MYFECTRFSFDQRKPHGEVTIHIVKYLQTQRNEGIILVLAQYISLSQIPRKAIPMMKLLQELKDQGFSNICTESKVYCKVFEDNSGAIDLAQLPLMQP